MVFHVIDPLLIPEEQEGLVTQINKLTRDDAKVITLSDRAYAGEYEDLNGPKIIDILKNYFQDQPWNISFEKVLITDNRNLLKKRSNKNPMQLYTVFLNIKTTA